MRTRKNQGGFALLEMSIAIGLGVYLAIYLVKGTLIYFNDQTAQQNGIKLAQFNSAVANWINAQGPAIANGNYAGIGWLQNAATCAGATGARDFLPCGWDGTLPWNLSWNTTITVTPPATPGEAPTVHSETNLGTPAPAPGLSNMPFGGRLIQAARAYLGVSRIQQAQGQLGITSYGVIPDPTGGANDRLAARVDTAVNIDPWLRVDGGNQMLADLNMGDGTHSLNNARDVNATGTVRGQDLTASRDVNAGRDTNTTRNASAGQNVTGNTVWGNNVGSNGNVSAGNDVTAGRDLTANRDVTANNNPALGGDVKIANTDLNNGQGPMALSGAMQGTRVEATIQGPDMFGYYASIPAPTCRTGLSPKVDSRVAQISESGAASPIGFFDTRAVWDGVAGWKIYLDQSTAATSAEHSPRGNLIAASVYCG